MMIGKTADWGEKNVAITAMTGNSPDMNHHEKLLGRSLPVGDTKEKAPKWKLEQEQ